VLNAPEPRYKIVERGRRLITIDTQSGKQIEEVLLPAKSDPDVARLASPWQQGNTQESDATGKRPGRMVVVAGVATVFVAFLIVSGAWIPVAIALAIAPVRALIWTALRTAVANYVNA
jgi:hypothetical protein